MYVIWHFFVIYIAQSKESKENELLFFLDVCLNAFFFQTESTKILFYSILKF